MSWPVIRRASSVRRKLSNLRHLLQNRESNWAETWLEALMLTWRFRIAKVVAFRYP